MDRRKGLLMGAALLAALAVPSLAELVTNGDFEQPLTEGWEMIESGAGLHNAERDPGYHPDADYEAMVSQISGSGWTKLSQKVDVPNADVRVSFDAKFEYANSSSTCWPVASISIIYSDEDGNELGETRYYHHDAYCTWSSSATLHLVEVADPDWQQYEFDVLAEIEQNLPGVDAGLIRQLDVALYGYTAGG